MDFMARSARHFMAEKAAREISQEILKAGLQNLKILAESGRSIIGTYLSGCSDERKKQLRQDYNALLNMGVTFDMILDKVARQIPELGSIMATKETYKQAELQKVAEFLKGS